MEQAKPEGTELARLVIDDQGQLVWSFDLMAMQRHAGDQLAWGIAAGDLVNHVANAGSETMGWNRRKFVKALRRIFVREIEKPTARMAEHPAPMVS